MENQALTPQQRENLAQHMARRLSRMPDDLLQELEARTRRLEDARALVHTAAPVSVIEARPAPLPRPTPQQVIALVQPGDMETPVYNRRQAIRAGIGGLFGMAVAGAGWTVSAKGAGDFKEFVRELDNPNLDAAVNAAIRALQEQFESLQRINAAVNAQASACDQVARQYQDAYWPALYSLTALRAITGQMIQLSADMQIDQVVSQMQPYAESDTPIAAMAMASILLGKFSALAQYLQKVPYLIQAASDAANQLSAWFSETGGVDPALLQPLHEALFPAIATLGAQTAMLQQVWATQVIPYIPRLLEDRQQIRQAAAG